MAMSLWALFVFCALALIAWLTILLIRLRLELWANRRVIAALEQIGVRPEKKAKAQGQELVYWTLFLLVLWLILSQLLAF